MSLHRMRRAAAGSTPQALVGTFISNTKSTTNSASYSWGSSNNIGTAPSGGDRRFVFVAASGTTAVDTITIGGSAATLLTSYGASNAYIRIGYLEVPSGTTVSLAQTHTSSGLNGSVSWWTVVSGPGGISVFDSTGGTADTQSLNANVIDGGFVIACDRRSNDATPVWTGVTARFNEFIESTDSSFYDHYHSGADHTVTADETPRTMSIEVSGGFLNNAAAVVSLKPL